MPTIATTDTEYWNQLQILAAEVEHAIAIYWTLEEVNRLALDDPDVLKALNRDAGFWNVHAYSLQCAMFVTIARIFDSQPDAISIHKLANLTLASLQIFSKGALAARKRKASGPNISWLEEYMRSAWEPACAGDLRPLKKSIGPHSSRFDAVYKPIRHSIFAHRLMSNEQAALQLFAGTNRHELSQILDFLHDWVLACEQLYLNGIQPVLGSRSFSDHNRRIGNDAERVIRKLVSVRN